MIALRKVAEDADSITLEWDAVAGATGYRFSSSLTSKRPHTWDSSRTRVKFAKGGEWYRVEALGVTEAGQFPAVEPPPPPPPNPPPPASTISPSEFTARATAGATIENVTVTGSVSVRNPDVTIKGCTIKGSITFEGGGHRAKMLNSSAGGLYIFGVDDTLIEGNSFDGHAYGTVSQNLIWEQPIGAVPQRTIIRGNTFRRFYGDDPSIHSEALFIGYSDGGLIEGNTFIDNGNTAHIFFSYWSSSANPSKRASNWCVRGNTFGPTHGAYFSVNFREEIRASDNIRVQPGQSTVAALTSHPQFNGNC